MMEWRMGGWMRPSVGRAENILTRGEGEGEAVS